MNFTQQQVSEILDQIASGENGYQLILKYSLEAIMRSERHERSVPAPQGHHG